MYLEPRIHSTWRRRSAASGGIFPQVARLERMAVHGPILGVDLGEKRIGLAISDPDGSIAFPAGFVASRGRAKDLEFLRIYRATLGDEDG